MIPHSVSVIRALKDLGKSGCADEMLSTWADTKKEIAWLLENDYPVEAQRLAADYTRSFGMYKHGDELTTEKVVTAFPVNNSDTLKLLGINDEIDAYILEHKVRIDQLSQANHHGFRELFEWSVQRQHLDLTTKIVVQIARDAIENHPGDNTGWCEAGHGMIRKLVDKDALVVDYGSEIDEALASIMVVNPDYRKDGKDIIRLAQFGLKKTVVKMLSVGLCRQVRAIEFSPEDLIPLFNALPSKPTAREWCWIQIAIDHPEIKEKILFDPSVDMQAYIEALHTTDFKLTRVGHSLTFASLAIFLPLLTPEHLNTPDRRRRARMLVNAVCNEESRSKPRNADQLRDDLKRIGYHDCVLRMCDLTKVSMLEDELGM